MSVVWTGPESGVSSSRLTAAAVIELINATRLVILLVSDATQTGPQIPTASAPPWRQTGPAWSQFVHCQAEATLACHFFSVEPTRAGCRLRCYVESPCFTTAECCVRRRSVVGRRGPRPLTAQSEPRKIRVRGCPGGDHARTAPRLVNQPTVANTTTCESMAQTSAVPRLASSPTLSEGC
jgi:hypothetical protein